MAGKQRKRGPLPKEVNNNMVTEHNPPKIWGKGPLKIFDIELDCYVLEDGTAVLSKTKMMKAIGRPWKGGSRTDRPNFIGAMNIQPFIGPKLEEKLQGIEFYDEGKLASGYHADILPLVCNVYLEAREAGVLSDNQLPIAQACEILLRSFARVGIVALIYEQLGYERVKGPDAIRLLVESYLAEEVRKWAKEFPDELFFQMDRIYGNIKTTSRNRPKYYAKFIRKYIYEPIERGRVLKALDKRNPTDEKGNRGHRHHSELSEEKGVPVLRSQIWQVVGVLKTSFSKPQFERGFARLMGQSVQESLFED